MKFDFSHVVTLKLVSLSFPIGKIRSPLGIANVAYRQCAIG